ncbi:MAG: methyl-accepting chemotaxis protein [Magnetococcales bacterium]|nr:methyl-accepting chemotaxis protein [Magnetococcales bacterium]
MTLKNMSIGERLGIGFGLIGILFALVAWQYHQTLFGVINRFDTLQETHGAKKTHFLNVHRYMLEARRSEKDFLVRKKMHYPERVAKYVQLLISETEKIKDIEYNNSSHPLGGDINALIHIYHQDFKKIVKAWQINGLDHNSGLQGKFRDTIHFVEKLVKKHIPSLEEEILTLRRREKDYLLRGDKSYVTAVQKTTEQILVNIKSAPLSNANKQTLVAGIKRYEKDFLTLVAHNNEIIRLTADMRSAVHKIEPMIILGVAEATSQMSIATQNTKTETREKTAVAMFIALMATFLGISFAYYFSRSITRPINTLTQLTDLFASPADSSENLDANQKDEIIILTNAMGRMTGHLRDIIYYFIDHITALQKMSKTLEENTNKTISPEEKKEMVASLQKMSKDLEEKMRQLDV